MEINFNGKKALVTGAGKGIGRDVAKALVKGGAETYALSRTKADLDSLKAEVPDIHCIVCDVSDWKATEETVKKLEDIDLLVNNAGVSTLESVLDVTKDPFDRIMTINLKAVFNISKIVASKMVARGKGGAIVNVSSQVSQRALEDHLVYSASKSALDQATRQMAMELGKHQIRVNSVNPTVVLTDMGKEAWQDPNRAEETAKMLSRIPQGKFAEIKDVVHPILYLLSDKSDMINGAIIPVDGGFWTA